MPSFVDDDDKRRNEIGKWNGKKLVHCMCWRPPQEFEGNQLASRDLSFSKDEIIHNVINLI